MGFVNFWFLMIKLCKGRPVIEVKSPVNFPFAINVRSVTLVNKENKSLGIVVMAVNSRWRVVREVRLRNESGKTPAGELPSPITCRDCSLDKAPISVGISAGTAGNVNCLGVNQCL